MNQQFFTTICRDGQFVYSSEDANSRIYSMQVPPVTCINICSDQQQFSLYSIHTVHQSLSENWRCITEKNLNHSSFTCRLSSCTCDNNLTQQMSASLNLVTLKIQSSEIIQHPKGRQSSIKIGLCCAADDHLSCFSLLNFCVIYNKYILYMISIVHCTIRKWLFCSDLRHLLN